MRSWVRAPLFRLQVGGVDALSGSYPEDTGSNPVPAMILHHRLIGIGHQPFKLEIAGSSPVGVTAPSSNGLGYKTLNLVMRVQFPLE